MVVNIIASKTLPARMKIEVDFRPSTFGRRYKQHRDGQNKNKLHISCNLFFFESGRVAV